MKRLILAMATVAGMLMAQVPGPPGLDALKTYLNLQDSQIQSLRQLRQQQIQATQAMFQELAGKQQALRQQLGSGVADAAALGKALLDIEALRKRIADTTATYRTQALNVLTGEQRTKLAALEQAQKLEPAVRQAEAIGLLALLEP
ncbi:MAG: periplasmic heavy metal sensor, partial [Bryobacteraceae bacterium]